MVNIGIVAGTGFKDKAIGNPKWIDTDFGKVPIWEINIGGKVVPFHDRHYNKEVPHLVKTEAFVEAMLFEYDVGLFIGVSRMGRITKDVVPGHFGMAEEMAQALGGPVKSLNATGAMTFPFPGYFETEVSHFFEAGYKARRTAISKIYKTNGRDDLKAGYHQSGVAAVVPGPRFLTPLEEKLLKKDLADVGQRTDVFIGMTPLEASIVREHAAYCNLLMCTDFSTTPPKGKAKGKHEVVTDAGIVMGEAAYLIVDHAIRHLPKNYHPGELVPTFSSDINLEVLSQTRPLYAKYLQRKLGL